MASLKPFKDHKEQIDILKERGLSIENEERAIEILKNINYYRLSPYLIPFKINGEDRYPKTLTIEKVYSIYNFDHELRTLLSGPVERIEVIFKSRFAYEYARTHKPDAYLDEKNFTSDEKTWNTWKNFKIIYDKNIINSKGNEIIEHHKGRYSSRLPIWAVVEILSFTETLMLFDIMDDSFKVPFAKAAYPLLRGNYDLWNFMQAVSKLRNYIAHYMRLYNKIILDSQDTRSFKDDSDEGNNKMLWGCIKAIKRLYPNGKKEWKDNFVHALFHLFDSANGLVKMEDYGFPKKDTARYHLTA